MTAPLTNELAALTARIHRIDDAVPEHLISAASDETDGALVDQWGQLHLLRSTTVIGRDPANALAVLHSSVSRRHAELRYDVDADAWAVVDLGSRNGTFVEGTRLATQQPHPLGDRQLLGIGDVELVFVLERDTLPVTHPTESYRLTAQSPRSGPGLRLTQPTSEGAGVVGYGDATISLGSTQFALLWLLAERYLAGKGQSEEVRGFVRSIELIASLPWNTANPEDNHVKQQVRRVRRALERLGLPEAIESRHGFGYRLRIEPILP